MSPLTKVLSSKFSPDCEIDFAADTPVLTQTALSRVTMAAQQLVSAQADVAELERRLKEAQKSVKWIEERELPEAMAEAKMAEFKMLDGKKITVKDVIAGSPPKERFDDALGWLRDNDHEGIIKRSISVTINLPKGQDEKADELLACLRSLEPLRALGVEPSDAPTIHYQTFGKWARELFAEHNEEHLANAVVDQHCPFCNEETVKLLGIYIGKKAEIK